jgi:hypothetical protein
MIWVKHAAQRLDSKGEGRNVEHALDVNLKHDG